MTRLGAGPWAAATGDALYAAMAVLLARFLLPTRSWRVHTTLGLAWCWLVELAQLTGVPAAIGDAVPLARLVLGTTFTASDLLAYAVGALGCAALIVLSSRCRSSVRTAWIARRADVEGQHADMGTTAAPGRLWTARQGVITAAASPDRAGTPRPPAPPD